MPKGKELKAKDRSKSASMGKKPSSEGDTKKTPSRPKTSIGRKT